MTIDPDDLSKAVERLAAAESVVEAARRVMDHPDGPGERCREKGRFIDGVCDGDCDVAIARYKALAAALDALDAKKEATP